MSIALIAGHELYASMQAEKAALVRRPQPWPSDAADPLPVEIKYWGPVEAKMRFLQMWEELRYVNGLPHERWEI